MVPNGIAVCLSSLFRLNQWCWFGGGSTSLASQWKTEGLFFVIILRFLFGSARGTQLKKKKKV